MAISHSQVEAAPAIQLNNLLFSWQAGVPALDIPELTIQPGEKVFIRGPSGSGKTTLLGLLGGVLVPERGSVKLFGHDINQLSPGQRDRFRAEHIGFIFQMFNLIPYLNVLENITLPLGFADQRSAKLVQQGVTPEQEVQRLLNHLGLDDPRLQNRKITELSIGQQQRVAAARALIGSPGLVIADEPTSALDSDNREHFIELLFAECERSQSTLIFVSHDSSLESLFDRTISLKDLSRHGARAVSQERTA